MCPTCCTVFCDTLPYPEMLRRGWLILTFMGHLRGEQVHPPFIEVRGDQAPMGAPAMPFLPLHCHLRYQQQYRRAWVGT